MNERKTGEDRAWGEFPNVFSKLAPDARVLFKQAVTVKMDDPVDWI